MSTSLSRGDIRIPMTSSIGSVRTFTPDGHVGSKGLELRTAGSHWKKPIDSNQGGNDDPPKKTPKDPQTSNNGAGGSSPPHGGYYGPGWPGHTGGGNSGPPLACRGRPGGC
jgi:hypothetical protein